MFFVCIDFAIYLIVNRRAFSTDALWDALDLWCLHDTLIVEDATNAVIIGVADVDFDVASMLVVER